MNIVVTNPEYLLAAHGGTPMAYRIYQGGDDMERIRQNLEAWYDSAMDRVSGGYRRRTQRFLFLFGLGAAVFLNVNAITIAEYAVMLALIIVVCLAAISTLGNNANATFDTVGQRIGSTGS